jgi:hypothetical protein
MKFGEKEIRPRDIFLTVWVAFCYLVPGYYLLNLENLENTTIVWAIVSTIPTVYVVVNHLVAEAAERKNQNYSIFFIIGFLISPLLMGIIVALMGSSKKKKIRQR